MIPYERNPHAFPKAFEPRDDEDLGIRLLDYFAAAALQGHMALEDNRSYPGEGAGLGTLEEWRAKIKAEDARYCYEMADAMLDARLRTLYRS